MEQTSKLGIFGGSFDPIHHGHLIAAQDAFEQLELSTLWFVPTAQAPLRDDSVRASGRDRLTMIERAIGDDPRFRASAIEIDRGGVSYTIDTVTALRKEHPEVTPVWIIGEDQVGKLPDWRGIEELCTLTEFACLERPGHRRPALPMIRGLQLHWLRSHQVEISSTEIRQRTREKRSLRFLLPEAVIDYVYEKKLYH